MIIKLYNWCRKKKTSYYKKPNLDKLRKVFMNFRHKSMFTAKSLKRISTELDKVNYFVTIVVSGWEEFKPSDAK